MLDFLFRFSVLNTAVTTIGKEIGDTLSGLRREWHLCLAVWTLYFGMSELQKSWLQVGSLNGIIFVFSTFYIAFVEYIAAKHKWLSFLNNGVLVKISNLGMQVSSPVVLWLFVWSPLNMAVTCMLTQCVGEKNGMFSPVVSVVLLLFVSALLLYEEPGNSVTSEAPVPILTNQDGDMSQAAATSGTTRNRRPPSVRIRERREKS